MNGRAIPGDARGDATVPLRGNFVMLRADSLRLLLPQQDVGAAEYVEGTVAAAGGGLFELGEGEQARPVVALSSRMEPLAQFPQDRFVLTRLAEGDWALWFAWNEARVLIDVQLQRVPLPPAMRRPGSPIEGYVELGGELLLCTSSRQLLASAGAVPG